MSSKSKKSNNKSNKEHNKFWLVSAIIVSSLILAAASLTTYAASNPVKQKQETNNQSNAASTTDTEETTVESDETSTEIEDDANEINYNKDPLERINRVMFTFNDKLDIYLIKPVAQLYNAVIPKPLNKGIHNFFNNLGEIPTIANDLLQLNFYQMTKDLSRLGINTTMGIGGLFDMATRMHIPYFQNDFGLTLARWGYKESSYLVIPFLGSNTIRDGVGIPVDYFAFSVYPYVEPTSRRYQLLGLFLIDHRANLLQFEPVLEEAAIDKYVFMRNAYMQHRAFQIEQIKHLGYKDRNANSSTTEANPISAGG